MRARWQAPTGLLCVAAGVYLGLYLYLLRDVGPANDEWTWLLYRPSLHGLIDPYNGGPVLGDILVYRLWANVIGVAYRWPLTLGYAALHLAVVALVYGMARRRVGAWAGLCVALLVLFLGRAWETLLFPASLTFVVPVLAAGAAWTMLDRRESPGGLILAAGLLAFAGVTGAITAAVLVGLTVELAAGRSWRRLWIVAVGAAPLLAWQVVRLMTTAVPYGAGGQHIPFGANLEALPLWSVKFVAAAAGAAVGLSAPVGAAVLVVALAVVIWRRSVHFERPTWWTPRALGLVATVAAAVIVTGAARASDTPATSSRYMYFPAVVLLLLLCELASGLQLPKRRAGVALAVGWSAAQRFSGCSSYARGRSSTSVRLTEPPPGWGRCTCSVADSRLTSWSPSPPDSPSRAESSSWSADASGTRSSTTRPGSPRLCPNRARPSINWCSLAWCAQRRRRQRRSAVH